MEAAGGNQEHGTRHSETVEVGGGALPAAASGTGETHEGDLSGASADAGHRSAQQLIEELRRIQEEIPSMGKAEVLELEGRLSALRPLLLQRIKEEEEKAAAAEKAP